MFELKNVTFSTNIVQQLSINSITKMSRFLKYLNNFYLEFNKVIYFLYVIIRDYKIKKMRNIYIYYQNIQKKIK